MPPPPLPPSLDSHQSVYREKIVEHALATMFLIQDWRAGTALVDILKPEIDRFGYDLMIIRGATTRFVQIKSSTINSPVASHKVHVNLLNKADGCVIWAVVDPKLVFDPQNLIFASFRVIIPPLGTAIGEQDFKVATHLKRNAQGVKTERPNIRQIPKARFATFKEVFDLLFPLPSDR